VLSPRQQWLLQLLLLLLLLLLLAQQADTQATSSSNTTLLTHLHRHMESVEPSACQVCGCLLVQCHYKVVADASLLDTRQECVQHALPQWVDVGHTHQHLSAGSNLWAGRQGSCW
jgi:hypothetical protein